MLPTSMWNSSPILTQLPNFCLSSSGVCRGCLIYRAALVVVLFSTKIFRLSVNAIYAVRKYWLSHSLLSHCFSYFARLLRQYCLHSLEAVLLSSRWRSFLALGRSRHSPSLFSILRRSLALAWGLLTRSSCGVVFLTNWNMGRMYRLR